MRWLAALLLMALPAHSNTLNIQIWPTDSQRDAILCTLTLQDGYFLAVELKGTRMTDAAPLRWRAHEDEIALMTDVMAAFLSEELPSIHTDTAFHPQPPFVSATYWVPFDDTVRSGTLILPGHDMPEPLANLIRQLLPGGLCASALG